MSGLGRTLPLVLIAAAQMIAGMAAAAREWQYAAPVSFLLKFQVLP